MTHVPGYGTFAKLPTVLEAGPAAAHNIRQWGNVGMFTPWRFCVDCEAAKLLARQAGSIRPPRLCRPEPISCRFISNRWPQRLRPMSSSMRA
jgi:hypothetical protein